MDQLKTEERNEKVKDAGVINDIWNWFNGRKRQIAIAYWLVAVPVLPIIYPTGVPDNINKFVQVIGIVLSAIGFGHAAIKSMTNK